MRERLAAIPVGVPLGHRPLGAVAIGASTGGPKVIERILADLPAGLNVPVFVCLHMPPGFTAYFAELLDRKCALRVKEAEDREAILPGCVYLATIGRHMRPVRADGECRLRLDSDFADSLHVPSIDIMLSSFAHAYGSLGLAVLLTGLGSDGALGMLAVRRAGGHTVCQSPTTAIAASMPESAIELGAVEEQVDADELAAVIVDRVAGRA
jgi:two-component system chemotaxis response regulator CheB